MNESPKWMWNIPSTNGWFRETPHDFGNLHIFLSIYVCIYIYINFPIFSCGPKFGKKWYFMCFFENKWFSQSKLHVFLVFQIHPVKSYHFGTRIPFITWIFPWFSHGSHGPGLVDCLPSSPGRLHEGRVVGLVGHRGGLRGDLRLG